MLRCARARGVCIVDKAPAEILPITVALPARCWVLRRSTAVARLFLGDVGSLAIGY